jgi:hypothetical protein
VSPSRETLRELLPKFCELVQCESEPAVRVAFGHPVVVYIPPYMDVNERMGLLLLAKKAPSVHPRTIIPVARRAEAMALLKSASVRHDAGLYPSLR